MLAVTYYMPGNGVPLESGRQGEVGRKVLVIDDDPVLLTLLRIALEQDGFLVTTALDGEDGLRQASKIQPDVIVLDIMMSDMDGWTTCRRLRCVYDTPILMLSARTRHVDVVRGLNLGADDYLAKPCSINELKARIRALLRRAHMNE